MRKSAFALLLMAGLLLMLTKFYWPMRTGSATPVEGRASIPPELNLRTDVVIGRDFLRDPDYPAVAKQVDRLFNSGAENRYAIQNVQSQFPGWLALMRQGDLKAAKSIWDATLKCSRKGWAPFSPESFRDMKEDEERFAKEANRPPSKRRMLEIATLYATCGNITKEQRLAGQEALKLLAESGNWSARSAFIQHGRPDVSDRALNSAKRALWEYRKKATEYLEAEIANGNVDAMLLSSALHSNNDYTSERGVLDYDPIRALANHLAATNVLSARLTESPSVSAQERSALQDHIAALERDGASISMFQGYGQQPFSPEQLREATKLALEIEGKCCK